MHILGRLGASFVKLCHPKILRSWLLSSVSLTLFLLSLIPIRLAIAYYQTPSPQAILILGGPSNREKFTAQFAEAHPHLDIWLSTGIPPSQAKPLFQAAGIPNRYIHLDYRATDTVTNFTTLVSDFKQRRIRHLYLITSEFHMPRATAIASVVLGSQGIAFTPVTVPSDQPQETPLRILRDIGRSLLWLTTGCTGARLKTHIVKNRAINVSGVRW